MYCLLKYFPFLSELAVVSRVSILFQSVKHFAYLNHSIMLLYFRRFNVAVTRGMALCVVIGQPQLLYADPHWREMIRFCVKHGQFLFCM